MLIDLSFIIISLHLFSALASADLFFCLTCISRGFRVAIGSTYYIVYPIIKFINQFAYTASVFLTVALIIHRYMVFVKGTQPKNEGFARIKKIIFGVVLGAFIYCIPMMMEFTWKNIKGYTTVVHRYSDDDSTGSVYKQFYKAWANFIVRFLVPTILLAVFSILIVREVNIFYKSISHSFKLRLWRPYLAVEFR